VELLTIIVCLVDIGGIVDHHCLFIVSFKNNQILNDLSTELHQWCNG
jgi:hypothetical protein